MGSKREMIQNLESGLVEMRLAIKALGALVESQQRQIQDLEALLTVERAMRGLELTKAGYKDPWWQNPIIKFRGTDAGEQANL